MLADRVPGVEGTLLAAVGRGADMRLVSWPAGGEASETPIPMVTGPALDVNARGDRIGFVGPAVSGFALYVGHPSGWRPAALDVVGFRWHDEHPNRIAWTEAAPDARICRVALEGSDEHEPRCVATPGTKVVHYDDQGFVVIDHQRERVVRLDLDGRLLGEHVGAEVIAGPGGRLLISQPDPGRLQRTFHVIDGRLQGPPERLAWAPSNAFGEYGHMAWAPTGDPARVAFLLFDGSDNWAVQVWTLTGDLLHDVDLPDRAWDVGFDATSSYVLIPGTDSGRHRLSVLDTHTGELHHVPFDDWVQVAHLIPSR